MVVALFLDTYKKYMIQEQRKELLRLLISEITISESREIDKIRIQLNKEVVQHCTLKEGEEAMFFSVLA